MATQEVLNGLTDVIQTCLEDKVQSGFDANAQLSIDIMREVAVSLEAKVNTYTDVEINTLKTLIENGEVDLGPLTDFMNTMKTMLDGDEDTEGYQVFEQLIIDTANNKTGVINATNSITQIQTTLNTFQTTINDHATRIAELEANVHDALDCEGCQDEIIGLIDSSFEDGCNETTAAIEAYRTTEAPKHKVSAINGLNLYGIELQSRRAWYMTLVTRNGVNNRPEVVLNLAAPMITNGSEHVDRVRISGGGATYEYINTNDRLVELFARTNDAAGDYFRGTYVLPSTYEVEFINAAGRVIYHHTVTSVRPSYIFSQGPSIFEHSQIADSLQMSGVDGVYDGSFSHALGEFPVENSVSKITFLMADGTEEEVVPTTNYDSGTTIEDVSFEFSSPDLEATGMYVHRDNGDVISYHILDLN